MGGWGEGLLSAGTKYYVTQQYAKMGSTGTGGPTIVCPYTYMGRWGPFLPVDPKNAMTMMPTGLNLNFIHTLSITNAGNADIDIV